MDSNTSTNNNSKNNSIIKSFNYEIGKNKKVFENILKQKKDNKRTGSDIYKTDEDKIINDINIINDNNSLINNCFNNINQEKNIPIRRLNSNEISNKLFENNSIKDVDLRKSSKSNSVYIEQISEGEIPEYDYINEKIINANWI